MRKSSKPSLKPSPSLPHSLAPPKTFKDESIVKALQAEVFQLKSQVMELTQAMSTFQKYVKENVEVKVE